MDSRILSCPFRVVLGRCLALVVLAALAGGFGCGGPKEAKESVSGKVTLNGEPVTGTIVFVGGGKESSPSPIGPDGGYRVENPPPGEVDILIKGFPGMGGPVATRRYNAAMPPDLSKTASTRVGVAPPLKYARAGAIPKLKVTGGRQKHDIALTP